MAAEVQVSGGGTEDNPGQDSEQKKRLERRVEDQNNLPAPNAWHDTTRPLPPAADWKTELASDGQHRGRQARGRSHPEDTGMLLNPRSGVHDPPLQAGQMTSLQPP